MTAIGAIELGGSHVSAALVDVSGAVKPPGLYRVALAPVATRDDILAAISVAARRVAAPLAKRWGVATPGPFDYERGISRIRGLGKLEPLFGTDLRAVLATELGIESEAIRFLNDAQAFALGEEWTGVARGHDRVIGLTIGTGLGSGFLAAGRLVTSGDDVPPEGRLDLVPFRGGHVEDAISGRAIGADAADVAQRARSGEREASEHYRALGTALAEFLDPWLERFDPSCLVFGGSITRAWDLFGSAFTAGSRTAARLAMCGPAEHLDEAPLLGAARYATGSAG